MAETIKVPQGMLSKDDEVPLGTLQINPEPLEIASQDADEEIYILARKDIITNFRWIFEFSILFVAPLIVLLILTAFDIQIGTLVPAKFQLLLALFYYAFIFTFALIRFNEWYFNVFIITNKRIIYYRYRPLTGYKTSEAELKRIEDVSESVRGFLPSFFDYGDLLVQTAAEKTRFQVKQIPKPTWLRDVLIDLVRLSRNGGEEI